jgi:hypothetical protein
MIKTTAASESCYKRLHFGETRKLSCGASTALADFIFQRHRNHPLTLPPDLPT